MYFVVHTPHMTSGMLEDENEFHVKKKLKRWLSDCFVPLKRKWVIFFSFLKIFTYLIFFFFLAIKCY